GGSRRPRETSAQSWWSSESGTSPATLALTRSFSGSSSLGTASPAALYHSPRLAFTGARRGLPLAPVGLDAFSCLRSSASDSSAMAYHLERSWTLPHFMQLPATVSWRPHFGQSATSNSGSDAQG